LYNSNLAHILDIFSDDRYIEIMKIIANEGHQLRTPDFIRKQLNVTKKSLNTMMGRLVPLGIVDMIIDHYELTRQGKEIFESLMMIEDATKIYYRLDAVDILEGKREEEIIKLIDTIELNKRLRQLIKQTITKRSFSPKQTMP
jgi:Mn-dependent DtxR family transcriptional regulator